MIEIILITAGITFALFFLFDLFYQKKKQYYYIQRFIAIVTISIPAFLDGMEFWKDKKEYFYIAFFIALLIGFFLILLWLHFYIIRILKQSDNSNGLSILSAIYDGYALFTKKINDINKINIKQRVEYNKTLLSIHKDLNNELPKFISSIYKSIEEYDDFTAYATNVMESFVSTFFSSSDARFTLREIDDENKHMITKITTKNEKPKDIPISSTNMIIASMKDGKPKIYSINQDDHFDTKGSIDKGIYEDYVTYCLLAEDGKIPLVSINLYVKGIQAKSRMKVLVDTSIFEIVSQALIVYLEKKGVIDNV